MSFWTDQTKKLLEQLKIEHPIIQAPMAGGPSTPELVAAVSNAGGLGSLGCGYLTPDQINSEIRKVKEKTDRPFNVNLFIPETNNLKNPSERVLNKLENISNEFDIDPPEIPDSPKYKFEDQLAIIIDNNVHIFSFTFGIPENSIIKELHSKNIVVVGTATSVEEGILLEQAGCDALVAQGLEAGGHRGSFCSTESIPMIGSLTLIPQLVDKVDIPIIASGGIMDGRGIVASLALGASAVQMGTAFLGCEEAGITDPYREKLRQSRDDSTVLTKSFSGKYARGITNRFIREMSEIENEVASYPVQNSLTRQIRNAAKQKNDPEYMSLWAGQGSGMTQQTNAKELLENLVSETKEILTNISSYL